MAQKQMPKGFEVNFIHKPDEKKMIEALKIILRSTKKDGK